MQHIPLDVPPKESDPESSLIRTYRYLRLAISSIVVVIAVAVIVTSIGSGPLDSISAYYYSRAQNVFVGALMAVSLALLVIAGRGASRYLLNLAALFALLLALVPTPIPGGTLGDSTCPPDERCVPLSVRPDVDIAVTTYVILGVLLLLFSLALRIGLHRRHPGDEPLDVWTTVIPRIPGVLVVVIVAVAHALAPEPFFAVTHAIATGLFFACIVAVSWLDAFRADPLDPPAKRWQRVVYSVVAVGLVIDIAILVVVVLLKVDNPVPPVLVGEFIALGFFSIFWAVQTIQKWNEPALVVATRPSRRR
jgi:hypothetical protein